ncbi:hypothetical protein [Tropicimonas sp. IMCC6043]|uniref:hypothetical protein n=1 Tax=Tropicimonas sp. IMCC6043 TaxID=2510645 RepID=UPI00101BDC42|nr:hypothetical protein [Tropicimonas sp. IMCC6043]RYH09654.1 hypothetical protein EU800_11955 [Tropicimonas sp. IMCC6043]
MASGVHAVNRFTVHERTKEGELNASGIAPFEGEDILPLARARFAALGLQLAAPREKMVQGLPANPGKRAEHLFERA